MTKFAPFRILTTLVAVAIAAIVGWNLWVYYMDAPWTRDGRVRADIVEISPDVSGLVTDVRVHDNEMVHTGDVLFVIDQVRYQLALAQAEATLASGKAAMDYAADQARRFNALSQDAVSQDKQQETSATAAEASAAYAQDQAALAVAQLNLTRSVVRATVNGYITNFSMRPGDYVTTGKPVTALVDTDSLYVDGYFEETKLPQIHVGDAATVRLMGGGPAIIGHVESIAAGITDQDRIENPTLLADVNPTFTWVRLASRVPVRIKIDQVPPGTDLVSGLTATVTVTPRS